MDIKEDISTLKHKKKDFETLLHFDPVQWIHNRPPELVDILCTLCGIDLHKDDQNKCMIIVKLLELIYGARNSRLILPLSFYENLLTFIETRNKKLISFKNKFAPGIALKIMSFFIISVVI